ncbi:hypothetical protein XELAEV_18033339mg [Xenopus laevis]|uniref:Uncharacterized protein n=1 Tax=Xenopus laevis TaxID=8355 RepID=A0A974CLG1_XENLA|nr:hypothetical protein XELAEV_18033339mg [Xenopus laevis]
MLMRAETEDGFHAIGIGNPTYVARRCPAKFENICNPWLDINLWRFQTKICPLAGQRLALLPLYTSSAPKIGGHDDSNMFSEQVRCGTVPLYTEKL